MRIIEVYGISTVIETTPNNEVYGVSTQSDDIKTTPNEVYGLGVHDDTVSGDGR